MIKNDITYEYRVFTNRLVDVESMEVGRCTSKSIKELKAKDKVEGRFFHTSDTDEWYFCWNGELQKLNLKGDSDVNAALAEVEKLIANANSAVDEAKKTASEAKEAAAEAKTAADAASAAVESIENKADKSEVEAVSKAVETKADKSVVDELSAKVALKSEIPVVPTNISAFINDAEYLTEHQDISHLAEKSELPTKVSDLENDRRYITIDDVPEITVPTKVSDLENDVKYLNKDAADKLYAPIGMSGSGDGVSKDYVDIELGKKQDVISDIDDIRANAALGATALQEVPAGYATENFVNDAISEIKIPEVPTKVSAFENDANYLTEHQSLDNYFTKAEVNKMVEDINALIGAAIDKTNTILA